MLSVRIRLEQFYGAGGCDFEWDAIFILFGTGSLSELGVVVIGAREDFQWAVKV